MNAIGVMLNSLGPDHLRAFGLARELGFEWVHTRGLPEGWLQGADRDRYINSARASGVKIASMFIGFDGQGYSDLAAIRGTVGLVIPHLREHRRRIAMQYVPLAVELKAASISAHIGFLPERHDSEYTTTVAVVRDIAEKCSAHGLSLNLETGQDPAAVLMRFIVDVNDPAVGVNFDPANFVIYGTDDPLSAFDALRSHIRGIHFKDAVRARNSDALGEEVALGQGEIDVAALTAKLRNLGFTGPFVIERESGADPVEEVKAARTYLEKVLAGM